MAVKSGPPTATSERSTLLLIVALTAALYLRTVARGVLPGDPGEFQMAAWNFGVAHATGYPLYLTLGGLWQHLVHPFGVSPALALNALSALMAVACIAFFFMLLVRWLPGPSSIRRAAAVLATAWLATNPTFWSQALIAEVYALHALFLVLILTALQRIDRAEVHGASPVWLFLLAGLSMAHHATTLLYAPGVLAFLWLARERLTRKGGSWIAAFVVLLAPLLLYLYVPLRATPAASPWYFPHIGAETLALYDGGVQGFLDFVTGRSISVGFRGAGEALGEIGGAFRLWRLHFGWVGLVLMAAGLYAMIKRRMWGLLAFTLLTVISLQLFNLFYAIGDILVYYIPIYVMGCLWLGFGAWTVGNGMAVLGGPQSASTGDSGGLGEPGESTAGDRKLANWELIGAALIVCLLYFPLRQAVTYLPNLDQSEGVRLEQMWQGILAGELAPGAILVSNDRNDIVPLYYAQFVDGARRDLTGLFPLIAPEARFDDVGSTVATALSSGAPVYLVKPMPGLETRFALEAQSPVVRVTGPAVARAPNHAVDQPFGPLTLIGFDREADGGENRLRLYWRVNQPIPGPFTTTVQLFDAQGNKVGQNDAVAGGQFYPTSLWKPGEELVEEHSVTIAGDVEPATLLVGMYAGQELTPLAPSIMIGLSQE